MPRLHKTIETNSAENYHIHIALAENFGLLFKVALFCQPTTGLAVGGARPRIVEIGRRL